jgi:aryl-alcohol dehydrogenase-like predicted oxidoreductase
MPWPRLFLREIESDQTGRAEELIGLGGLEYGFPVNFERLRRTEILAEKYGKSVSQIALAWLASQPLNLLPVTSTGTISHLQDSIEALQLQLHGTRASLAQSAIESPDE